MLEQLTKTEWARFYKLSMHGVPATHGNLGTTNKKVDDALHAIID